MMIIKASAGCTVKGKRHEIVLLGWCFPHHCTGTAANISSSKRETMLRIAWPQLFAHCDSVCRYTTWSLWRKVPNSVMSVPPGKCPSGEAYTEERRRTATGNGCTEAVREMQHICELKKQKQNKTKKPQQTRQLKLKMNENMHAYYHNYRFANSRRATDLRSWSRWIWK